jgi:hypothetical protein
LPAFFSAVGAPMAPKKIRRVVATKMMRFILRVRFDLMVQRYPRRRVKH